MTERRPRERKALWVVRDNGRTRPALAFVLSGYGDAWVASGLGRELGSEHSLYALQPPSAAGGMSADDLAATYADALRAAHPHGPYALCGYSAGAVMAVEVAERLRAGGAEVGLVALLDPFFVRWDRYERACYAATHGLRRFLERVVRTPVALFQILAAMDADEGFHHHLRALSGHRLSRYPGEILCYRTRQPFGRSPFVVQQLRRSTGAPLRIEYVPGNHHTFIRPPFVAGLAERLRGELRRLGGGVPA